MSIFKFWFAAFFVLATNLPLAHAVQKYWDINGATPGAGRDGGGFSDGAWDTTATNWSTSPLGDVAPVIWAAGDDAVFSAGDATLTPGADAVDALITISGTQTATTVTIEEGIIRFRAGIVDSPQFTVKSGATMEYDTISRIGTTAGKITLQNGTLSDVNFGSAGSFARATESIEVDGTGTLNYPDASFRLGNATDCNCAIYTPTGANTILGVGGTTTNGAGTLVKTGAGEVRFQGVGLPNTTFAKLVVKEGLFRLGFNSSIQDERGFGAVPAAVLPDAITLDGGYIAHSFNATTMNANRGITVTANGGGWAGGTITVPGPLSGPGTFSIIGGQVTLTNSGNATTFTGKHNIENGTLVVGGEAFLGAAPVSPTADYFSMGGVSPLAVATTGTLSVTTTTALNANRGITLNGAGRINVATGGNTVTYGGVIAGSGKFTKMGDGTLAVSGPNTFSGGADVYGKLLVTNSSGSATGTGAVAVKTLSATLGGNGTLAGTGLVTGPVTIESGAHIAPGTTGVGTLGVGSLTLSSGSILDFDLGAPTSGDLVNVTDSGGLTISGGTVNLTNAGGLAAGTYKLLDYTGTLGGAFANLALGTQPAGFTFALVDNAANTSIDLSVTGGVGGVAGDYNGNGVVDMADYVLWRNGGPLQNEGSTVGTVDASDYDFWRAHFGNTSGSGSGLGSGSAVPEPTSLALVVLCLGGLVARRGGR
jgi:fibronectin-binding autotransporter adhesin